MIKALQGQMYLNDAGIITDDHYTYGIDNDELKRQREKENTRKVIALFVRLRILCRW